MLIHPVVYIVGALTLGGAIFCGLVYWANWDLIFPKHSNKTHHK